MKIFIGITLCAFFVFGVFGFDTEKESVSVMKGGSVTLNTGVKITQKYRIKWYFNDIRIAQITGDQSKVCTDDQCPERFRDRLKLDHQTGSLTITNTKTTDSGLFKLQIISSDSSASTSSEKVFSVNVTGVSGADTDVFVMEGDSLTLNTDAKINQQDRIKWYFSETRIAQIIGDQSKICTDDQCPERFRDRLKLDHQTGSLTITNINTTHTGLYKLQIITTTTSSSSSSDKTFSVSVRDVPAVERVKLKTKSVKKGESVTLDPGAMKTPNDVMTWYFNEILIAEITGDQSQICTDDQCKERFRDRLKLDHQTGSLTITNTRITDAGLYKLQIISGISNNRRRHRRSVTITSVKSVFSVSVIGSGLSSAAVAGIVAVVLLVFAVAGVIYYRHHRSHTPVPQNEGTHL